MSEIKGQAYSIEEFQALRNEAYEIGDNVQAENMDKILSLVTEQASGDLDKVQYIDLYERPNKGMCVGVIFKDKGVSLKDYLESKTT